MYPYPLKNVIDLDEHRALLSKVNRLQWHFVDSSSVEHLQTFIVYRCFLEVDGMLASPFPKEDRLLYDIGKITLSKGNMGISCHSNRESARRLMKSLKRHIDKIVLCECLAYNKGEPRPQYPKKSGWTSDGVLALKPIKTLLRLTDIV